MKSYIYKLCLMVMASIMLTACFDLEHEEFGSIASSNFPSSERDLEAAAVGVYNRMGESYIKQFLDYSGLILNTITTDEMNTGWGSSWLMHQTFTWTANNSPASRELYFNYQRSITRATRLIDAFQNSSVEEKNKTAMIAELRVLRVFYANALYALVGPAPIVTDPEIAKDVYTEWKPARPTKEEFVNFMVKELKESAPLLVNKQSADNWGRMDKGSALTLLMKIYLDAKMFDEANKTADEIIGLGIYELLPSYESVFDIANEGPGNKEVIFAITKIISNTTYAWTYFACVMPSTPRYKTKTGVTMNVWGGLKMPWPYYDKYEKGDERLNTIIRYYEDIDGNWVDFRTVTDSKATGAIPMKYSEDPNQRGEFQSNDFIVFRYADVLLSKAEALNELNGPTSAAVELINQIRRRAKIPEIQAGNFTKESLRNFILDERGRELYNEGWRRSDLIRHGKFIQNAVERGINAQPYHVLFPIPQDAIDENPNLRQNDGYEK